MELKPLKQEDFIMKIIEDLGVVERPKWKTAKRAVILECTECGAHVEKDAVNGKIAKYCESCKHNIHQAKLTKPLNQSEYKMKIIQDLGRTTANENTTRLARYAIFECTECKTHFKARAGGSTAKNQTKCQDCANTNKRMHKHPLYPVWNGIKQRCYSPKRKDYARYGGIGVTMADEWIDDPVAFINWCETNGWKPGLEIDKDIKCRELNISPAKYAPETLSFVTSSENSREAVGRSIDQFDLEGNYIQTFRSAKDAADYLGKRSGDTITNVCRKRAHTSYGFKWAYSEERNN